MGEGQDEGALGQDRWRKRNSRIVLDYPDVSASREALKTLANFRSVVMAGLDPAIHHNLKYLVFF